jgi:protein-S-isoprenylcysteine O-methyltransferase Ste14
MATSTFPQAQPPQADAGKIVELGGWLFRWRTVAPLPLALAVLLAPRSQIQGAAGVAVLGAATIAAGEAIRIWSVRHIGTISRTRSGRLGPLVSTGPFALVRNPLYIGNVMLWLGFALLARTLWLAPIFTAILAFQYHSIVRWEERLLEERLGPVYRAYVSAVPRWIPTLRSPHAAAPPFTTEPVPTPPLFSWGETFHSERGTLIAIAVGVALLWLKSSN